MGQLAVFEQERNRLWAVAYRITGSVADADDAVQETWLRWQALPGEGAEVGSPRAYLTTVVSRICYDQLTSARARRESYVGTWLPEPLVTAPDPEPAAGLVLGLGPEERVTLDESVGIALLTVLERLTPAERVAFILHDVFAVSFPEIAEVLGRSADSARQLASRGRRRARSEAPRRSVDRAEHQRAVDAFVAAVTNGDFEALLEVLDPEVVLRSDGGGKVVAARLPVIGGEKVATFLDRIARGYDPARLRLVGRDVNSAPGVVLTDLVTGPTAVYHFTVRDNRITGIDVMLNPEKLRHVRVEADAGAE